MLHNAREGQAIVEVWTQEYNNYRPASSLAYPTQCRSLSGNTTKIIGQTDIDSHEEKQQLNRFSRYSIGDTLLRLQLKEVS